VHISGIAVPQELHREGFVVQLGAIDLDVVLYRECNLGPILAIRDLVLLLVASRASTLHGSRHPGRVSQPPTDTT
jgi:hypothetical protein